MSINWYVQMKKDLVVKDNSLINAGYTLDLIEQRLILLAVSFSKKEGVTITSNKELMIDADFYSKTFNVEKSAAYRALKSASETLFNRYFIYEQKNKLGIIQTHKSRWVSEVIYQDQTGVIKLMFAPSVIPLISELEKCFTSYYLSDVSKVTSVYGIRLYELLMGWKSILKTPFYSLEDLKFHLGIKEGQYKVLADFKKRVLDIALSQINEHTNIDSRYIQHKKGRVVTGFSFEFVPKNPLEFTRDPKTVDWINGVPDANNPRTIKKEDAERFARPGESWEEVWNRLKNEGFKLS